MQFEQTHAMAKPTAQIQWDAVQNCDSALDGKFVYAVLTTGVYCRPSCRSKKPNRENVEFFDSPEKAEKAGYRPCKRCRPTEGENFDKHAQAIELACRLMESEYEPPSIDAIAKSVGMSRFHFQRVFKKSTGVTPKAYAETCRFDRAKKALENGGTVLDAIFGAGFNSASRFYEKSNQNLGMKPQQFRDAGRESRIKFAVGECSLGSVLVAATEVGICAIDLGDDPNVLVRDFQNRFSEAELQGADQGFEEMIAVAVGLVEFPSQSHKLPLDVRGTVFQRRVWEELRKIPAGSMVSYTDVAEAVGQPNAVRAVANACARNKIAIAIPCHRVVRLDGKMGGYRWGVDRKAALLEKEKMAAEQVIGEK